MHADARRFRLGPRQGFSFKPLRDRRGSWVCRAAPVTEWFERRTRGRAATVTEWFERRPRGRAATVTEWFERRPRGRVAAVTEWFERRQRAEPRRLRGGLNDDKGQRRDGY